MQAEQLKELVVDALDDLKAVNTVTLDVTGLTGATGVTGVVSVVGDKDGLGIVGDKDGTGATGATVINNARGEGLNLSKTFLGLTLETQRDVSLSRRSSPPD